MPAIKPMAPYSRRCSSALVWRSSAAAITAVEPVWNASTSAPWFISVMAASRSRGGLNHSFSQITLTVALGFTLRRPTVKALMPCSTSGIGKPAT